jgi:hypothetical protein
MGDRTKQCSTPGCGKPVKMTGGLCEDCFADVSRRACVGMFGRTMSPGLRKEYSRSGPACIPPHTIAIGKQQFDPDGGSER